MSATAGLSPGPGCGRRCGRAGAETEAGESWCRPGLGASATVASGSPAGVTSCPVRWERAGSGLSTEPAPAPGALGAPLSTVTPSNSTTVATLIASATAMVSRTAFRPFIRMVTVPREPNDVTG